MSQGYVDVASGTGGGSLRIRKADDGVVLDSPRSAQAGVVFAVISGLVSLACIYALATPPYDETTIGVLVLVLLMLVFAAVSAGSVWLIRLGLSRLHVDAKDLAVRAQGPRWQTRSDPRPRVIGIAFTRGPDMRVDETRSRPTWTVELRCLRRQDRVDLRVLRAVDRSKVQAKGHRLADLLELPLENLGDDPPG